MKWKLMIGCLLVTFTLMAQEESETKTLTQQYRALSSEMEVIDGYRMVKLYTMDRFWGTVMDSIRVERDLKLAAESKSQEQQTRIKELETQLKGEKSEVSELEDKIDNLNVAGLRFSKGAFVAGSFIVIIALAVLLVLAVLSTRMSYRAVKDIKRLYENTNMEFDRYKHNAVEKEIKLSRELQDYRNRYSQVPSN